MFRQLFAYLEESISITVNESGKGWLSQSNNALVQQILVLAMHKPSTLESRIISGMLHQSVNLDESVQEYCKQVCANIMAVFEVDCLLKVPCAQFATQVSALGFSQIFLGTHSWVYSMMSEGLKVYTRLSDIITDSCKNKGLIYQQATLFPTALTNTADTAENMNLPQLLKAKN